ncbi:MAG: hypothetical protein ABIE42_09060 [Candidatus Eisenbacteria bacterium]
MPRWRSFIATRVVDPLGWKIKGTDLGGRLTEFRARQWDDPDAWRRRRDEFLGQLLIHCVTRVPYYAARVGGLTPESITADPLAALRSFPILGRSELIEHFDELHCDMGRGAWLDKSGGSTGTPVRFLHDKHYKTAAFATTQLSFDWAGVARGDRRVGLWAARRDLVGRHSPVRRLSSFFRDITILDAFRMCEGEMREYVDVLNRRRPVCLDGYTEAIFALAEFVERDGLDVASPRAVATTAGTLLPHMREKIGQVFRAPIFDRYGTREAGLIATECDRHQGLHLMGETTVLEILDRNGREVGVGESGETVATNLWNYTMPLIRYRVQDQVVRGPDLCGCGRSYPMVQRIVGRAGSCFPRPGGGIVLPELWVRLFGVEFDVPGIDKYQFVQEELDRITARIVLRPGYEGPDLKTREAIVARICDVMGAPCHVDFSIEDDIPPTESGKHLYSVSKVESS